MHGYREEGTTTTPFDMTVLNELDRYHLAGDVIDRVPRLQSIAAHAKQHLRDKLVEHRAYVTRYGKDMPEIARVALEGPLSDAILAVNAGSSSLKFALFEVVPAADPREVVRGRVEGIGAAAHFVAHGLSGDVLADQRWPAGARATHEDIFGTLLPWVRSISARTGWPRPGTASCMAGASWPRRCW